MVGRQIKQARTRRDVGLRELARRADTSASSLARIEAGLVSPTFKTIQKLAAALDVDPHDLLAGEQDLQPPTASSDSLTRIERRILEAVRLMDRDHQDLVLQTAESFANVNRAVQISPQPRTQPHATGAPNHYLQGWAKETAVDHLNRGYRLGHTASTQFSKPFVPIRPNDVLWVVFVEHGSLWLLGRLIVGSRSDYLNKVPRRGPSEVIFSQKEAERVLKRRDLWDAEEHLLAKRGTQVKLTRVAVPIELVLKLRFRTSAGTSPIKISSPGLVSGQAFRSIRLLTSTSADELEAIWLQGAGS